MSPTIGPPTAELPSVEPAVGECSCSTRALKSQKIFSAGDGQGSQRHGVPRLRERGEAIRSEVLLRHALPLREHQWINQAVPAQRRVHEIADTSPMHQDCHRAEQSTARETRIQNTGGSAPPCWRCCTSKSNSGGIAAAMPMVRLALERSEVYAPWRRVCDLIVVALVRHERVLCNLQLNGCVQAPECDARPLIPINCWLPK
jgi:hypothetical protein